MNLEQEIASLFPRPARILDIGFLIRCGNTHGIRREWLALIIDACMDSLEHRDEEWLCALFLYARRLHHLQNRVVILRNIARWRECRGWLDFYHHTYAAIAEKSGEAEAKRALRGLHPKVKHETNS